MAFACESHSLSTLPSLSLGECRVTIALGMRLEEFCFNSINQPREAWTREHQSWPPDQQQPGERTEGDSTAEGDSPERSRNLDKNKCKSSSIPHASPRKWLWKLSLNPFLFMPGESTLGNLQGIGVVGFHPGNNGNPISRPIRTHPDLPGKHFTPLASLVS